MSRCARLRGECPAIDRGNEDWLSYFRREMESLLSAMDNYVKYLSSHRISELNDKLILTSSAYSPSVMPKPPSNLLESDLFDGREIRTGDAQSIVEDRYDAIICDPPYGFNTDEEFWEFGRVIRSAIRAALKGLRQEGGQILMACPQVSYSGREVMVFVQGDAMTRDIMRIAAEEGLECYSPAFTALSASIDIHPPYYWIAEKTMRRSILHFWVRSIAPVS